MGVGGALVFLEREDGYGVGLWKAISSGWDIIRGLFIMCNGRRVKFQKDIWCGDSTIRESFSLLYSISLTKEAWVGDIWDCHEEGGLWNTRFSRNLKD